MNIIFMRHGEATNNVKEIISDKEVYWSVLTEEGIKTVKKSINCLPPKIDKIYVSPLPRTIQTAHFISKKYPKTEVIIENRIREINNGKYSGKKNNKDLDNIRIKQIGGDYFVRFGEYGENKYDIEFRLCKFLTDIYNSNFNFNTILIISHGSIISYIKRILNIKYPHIKTGKIEEAIDIDFNFLFKHIKQLNKVKKENIKARVKVIESLNIKDDLKNQLIKLAKKEFNNIEFPDSYFSNFIEGIGTKNPVSINKSNFDS